MGAVAGGLWPSPRFEPCPRQQLGSAAVQTGVHPISVELDLVEPIRAAGRRVDQLAELRLDPLLKTGRGAARPVNS